MSSISHWLNTELHVWRETTSPDGSGGFTVSYLDQGAAMFKVDQSSAAEALVAAQSEASHTHNIYAEPDADLERTDRLAASGVDPNNDQPYYRIVSTTTPSTPPLPEVCRRTSGVEMTDVTVDTSAIREELNRASDEILAALSEAVNESARSVRQHARQIVPVDTGNLRDSIAVRSKTRLRSEVYVNTTDAHYGHIVEFGASNRPEQPFMGPAAEMERSDFKQRVVAAVKKVADG